jgi:CubicO group peptidase (beta-lactamase class C family)
MAITRRSVLLSLPAMSLCGSRSLAAVSNARARYDFAHAREEALAAIAARKATGLAMAAVHRGRIVCEQGFGWANREARLQATAHTAFSLASISKTFTTTVLATLAQEDKLSLDEPANHYLGELSLRGIEADAVTVRELGAHASGLPSLFEMFPVPGGVEAPSIEALLHSYSTLAFPPRTLYEYSNIGYAALGAIATRLTGLEIGALITQRVLAPLGLGDSFFDTDRSALGRAAARYDERDRPIPYYTTATPASGEVYASAHDLALFALFNLKSRADAERPLLSERWIDELHAPVLHGPEAGATTFGWFSGRTRSGQSVLFKDGGQPGVSTIMYLVPAEQLACLVLTNRSDNGELTQVLVDHMLAAVLPGWTTPDTTMNAASFSFSGQPPYVGRWTGRLSGGGTEAAVELDISGAADARLAIDSHPPQQIVDLRLKGAALTGSTTGVIPTQDAQRGGANQLSLELLPYNGFLVGRILASASSPGRLATIPVTVSLSRTHA